MGDEKSRKKSGGLLNLFDWKKKSRRKLLSCGSSVPKSTHGEKLEDDSTTARRVHCEEEEEEEEEEGTMEAAKGSGDVSSPSLMTHKESAIRAPGVVARLMGLDSMPSASELNLTLNQDLQSFQGKDVKIGGSNFLCNGQFTHVLDRGNADSRRTASTRTPSSPLEGFPLKWTKSSPVSCHKLSSSMKSPIVIPQKNVIHLSEEAAKDHFHPSWTIGIMKGRSFGSSSTALRYKDSPARLVNSCSRPAESAAARSSTSHQLNRNLNYTDGGIASQSSQLVNGTRKYVEEVNRKESKSPSQLNKVNVKVNVQRKEVSSNNNRILLFGKGNDGCEADESLYCKKSRKMKTFSDNASVVFRKNVLQPKKESFGSLSSVVQSSKFQGRNLYSKKKIGNKLSVATKFDNPKCSSLIAEEGEEENKEENLALVHKSLSLNKGFIEKNSLKSEKIAPLGSSDIDSYGKCVLHNVVLDEHSWWTKDNMKNGTDVVSFSFATPIVKPALEHHIPSQVVEREEKENERSFGADKETKTSCFVTVNQSSNVLDNIDGDALGILLEQKLNELASHINSPYSNSLKARAFESSLDLQVSGSKPSYSFNEPDDHGSLNCQSYDNHMGGLFQLGHSADALVPSMRIKDIDEVETSSCSSSGSYHDVQKDPHHQSPLSILEASFSPYESFDSPEGSLRMKAKKTTSYLFHVQDVADVQLGISDSICSALGESMWKKEEMEYVEEILCCIGLMPKCTDTCLIAHSGNILNPNLFQELECRRSRSASHDKGDSLVYRLRRKLLFDCVNACLDLKFSIYFQVGYRAWSKGVAFGGKGLAEELFKEISVLRSMENLMVDELLDRDMSDQGRQWVDFDAEAFEAGEEIGRAVLSSLVEELVTDFLTHCS